MKCTTRFHILLIIQLLWHRSSRRFSDFFPLLHQFLVFFVSRTLSSWRFDETTGNRTKKYRKSLSHAQRFHALLQSARAWLSHPFKILFHWRICKIYLIYSCIGNSLVHCSFRLMFHVAFSICLAIKIVAMYWVCFDYKWNRLPGAKRDPYLRSTPNSFTSSPRLRSLLRFSKVKETSLKTSLKH